MDHATSAPALRLSDVSRPRILAEVSELDAALLITLVAPAGYGKTTAAASIIAERNAPNVWIPIEERASTPLVLWQRTTDAITSLVGPVDERPLADLALNTKPDPDAIHDLISSLIAGLERAEQPHIIGFDDVHHLDDSSLEALHQLVELAPPLTTFVLTSRRDLPWDLQQLRDAGQILEIGVEDLTFDLDTTRLVLEVAAGSEPVDADSVSVLHSQAEGWPLAVGLAADAVRRTGGDYSAVDHHLSDGLLGRVEASITTEQLALLTDLSVLITFDDEVASAVTDAAVGIEIADLAASSSMIVAVDDAAGIYRLHHLVGELLSERLRANDPARYQQLHASAADWYLSKGDRVVEIEHRLHAQQYAAAAEVLIATSSDLALAGRMPLHLEWIKRMPDEFVADHPRIAAQLAEILVVRGEIEESRNVLTQAERSIEQPSDEIWVLAGRFFVAWSVGNARSAVTHFEALTNAVEFHASSNQPAGFPIQQQLLALAGLCYELLDEHEQARRVSAWLDRTSMTYPDLGSNTIVGGAVARQLATDGYMGQAAERATSAVGGPSGEESPMHTDAHVALAHINWAAGRLDDANRSLIVASHLDPRWTELFVTVRTVIAAEIAASSQRFDQVDEMLRDAMSKGADDEATVVIRNFVTRRAVTIYAAHQRRNEALEWASLLNDHDQDQAPALAWASHAWALGNSDDIIGRFLASGGRLPRHPLPMVRSSLLLAQALADVDRSGDAQTLLQSTLVVAERHHLLQPVLDSPLVGHLFDPERPGGPTSAFAETLTRRIASPTRSTLLEPLIVDLSPREHDLVPFLPSRASNRQIANELFVSLNTVKTHLKAIYRKLGVSSRDEAVVRCRELGLLTQGPQTSGSTQPGRS